MRIGCVGAAFLAVAGLSVAGSAVAGSKTVQYGPAPAWVSPPPSPTGTTPPEGAALQVIYADNQTRLGPQADEYYTAYRIKLLKPEALALGNVNTHWRPDSDDLRVHSLKIIRNGRAIDVLATTRFRVIQREDNLEASMLSGDLTANLQAPGLQVGDELEFAATIKRRDPTLGDLAQGSMMMPPVGAPGAYRMRLSWAPARKVRWFATPDLGAPAASEENGESVLSYELKDPKSVTVADGAPLRANLRRLIQFSSFSTWSDVSNLLRPLYEQSATLAPNSPIRTETARIAASTSDPAARASAALRLVQERIRYVYVGLNDGNYRPATADETWTRRFGDCKAKSALLLAVLRELGVPAEIALVNSQGADGANERLPMLGAFDHVVVSVALNGRTYWLDGTRMGDLDLSQLPPAHYLWALPLRAGPVDLLSVPQTAPLLAEHGVLIEVDASKGFDTPAKVTAEQVFRGDAAIGLKTAFAQMSKDDADRALRAFWVDEYSWLEPESVSWRYDPALNMTVVSTTGEGEPEWDGDAEDGRYLDIYGAGFSPPAPFKRPRDQDQTAPWLTDFPSFKRWTTIIRLPPEKDGFSWSYSASDVDQTMGGVAYWREAELENGVLRTTMSRRTLKPEISAAEAREVNKMLPSFDNKVSRVYQTRGGSASTDIAATVAKAEAGNDASALVWVGHYHLEAERFDPAARAFDRALALDPASSLALDGKIETLARRGDKTQALKLVNAALKQKPTADLALIRARLTTESQPPADRLAAIETVLTDYPKDMGVVAALVRAARDAGQTDRGLAVLDTSVAAGTTNVVAHRLRASLYSELGRDAEALADLDEAVRLQPESALNFRNRGLVLRKMGRLDAALADLDEALRIDPLDTSVASAKARTLRLAGRGPEAVALLDLAVARHRSGMTLNNRCWQRALANIELDKAESDCAEAVKLTPKSASYWDSYALVALRTGRLDEALKRYDTALTLNARTSAALYGRGIAKLRKGDETGGRSDIAAAKALTPKIDEELTEAGVKP